MPTEVQLIKDNAVNSDDINNLTITADDIANGAVTSIKLEENSNGRGNRYIRTFTPTTEGNDGDVWYQIT